MNKDPAKNPQFSAEQVRQLLASPEGKQLLAMLNRDGGKGLRQAAEEYRKGNLAGAQEVLRPIVDTPEASKLLEKISRK